MKGTLAMAFAVFAVLAGAGPAVAERLVASLSNHRVMITSNYTGVELVLFGVIERENSSSRHGDYGIVDTITKNIEVGAGGHSIQPSEVLSYALFAAGLPAGHVFQDDTLQKEVTCNITCEASPTAISDAINEFENPDVG